ncbi:TetR family transcriptional regulator [Paenibacillus sp. DLE-14]|uniref:TetR family transcriptional regulator n=1 Tax=Paenibacillus lignilyticus TaxID=1172615 RepID=A0ABS5CMN9_9BACL|nr:TetR family transcriptional regulator [Paenibacillus lignilyticus]
MGAIAELLKISKGVVTYHFSQKDQIIQELVESLYHDSAAFMASHMPCLRRPVVRCRK